MKRRFRWLGATVAVVLALSLAAAGAVYAQGPGVLRGRLGSTALEAIAKALGMTADELSSQLWGGRSIADLADKAGVDLQSLYNTAEGARDESRLAAIDAAVKEGTLSAAQAAWMKEGISNGYGDGQLRMGLPGGRGNSDAEQEAIATALGLTVSELQANLWGGRTLADLADRAGVKIEDVQAAAQAAREQALRDQIASAVANGEIAQAQADWMVEGLENGYLGQSGPMMGPEWGGGHPFGGPWGFEGRGGGRR
jgi:hypothetical protein